MEPASAAEPAIPVGLTIAVGPAFQPVIQPRAALPLTLGVMCGPRGPPACCAARFGSITERVRQYATEILGSAE